MMEEFDDILFCSSEPRGLQTHPLFWLHDEIILSPIIIHEFVQYCNTHPFHYSLELCVSIKTRLGERACKKSL